MSLGTHEQPFGRALDAVAPLAAVDELVVQHGYTTGRLDFARRAVGFVAPAELTDLMTDADAVVCHAGVGTMMLALAAGKMPVVIPRLREFGEHVDDHQLQIAKAFVDAGYAIAVLPGDDVSAAVERARATPPRTRRSDDTLRRAVAAAASGRDRPPSRHVLRSREPAARASVER